MRRILLTILALLMMSLLTGCVYDTEYQYQEPQYSYTLDEMVSKHETFLGKDKQSFNGIYHNEFNLSNYIDGKHTDIKVTISNNEYLCKEIGPENVLVYKNDELVGYITITPKVNKNLLSERIEEYSNFSVTSNHKWQCYKAIIDNGETEIFIFKNLSLCQENGYSSDLEISGYDIKELENIISSCNSRLEFFANYEAIWG